MCVIKCVNNRKRQGDGWFNRWSCTHGRGEASSAVLAFTCLRDSNLDNRSWAGAKQTHMHTATCYATSLPPGRPSWDCHSCHISAWTLLPFSLQLNWMFSRSVWSEQYNMQHRTPLRSCMRVCMCKRESVCVKVWRHQPWSDLTDCFH